MEAGEELFELGVRKQKGIATGEENVADLGSVFEILDGPVPLGFEFLVRNPGDDTGAGAVSAVGRAAVGDEEEDAIGIAMDKAGDGHVGVLTTGVGHFRGIGVGFLDAGNDLTPDGAIGVRRVDEVEEMGRDRGGELGAGQKDASAFFVTEGKMLLNVREGRHPVLELPFGRIPVFGGHVFVGPVTWSRGCEGYLAQSPISVDQFWDRSKISGGGEFYRRGAGCGEGRRGFVGRAGRILE